MEYTERELWEFIDGNVTPSQHAAFHEARKLVPGLSDKYHNLLKMHRRLQAYFAATEVNTQDCKSPVITPLRQQDPMQH